MIVIDNFSYSGYKEKIGTKSYNLFLMGDYGIRVPRLTVLSEIDFEDWDNATREEIVKYITSQLERFSSKVIIRSSANMEDGESFSFAGVMESAIINDPSQIPEALNIIKDSLSSSKLIEYLRLNKIESKLLKLNLIVQEYIPTNNGGVIFSVDPMNPSRGILVNSSQFGSKTVVDGEATNSYNIAFLAKVDNSIDTQIQFVVQKLQQIFKYNLDIEYLLNPKKQLVILQVRPAKIIGQDKYFLVDSSNIQENLPTPIKPLTASFLERIYYETYSQLIVSSSNQSRVNRYDYLFGNLLAFDNGYVYYNIGNWYNFTQLLPNADKNNQSLKNMIGGKVPIEKMINHNTPKFSLSQKITYYSNLIYKLITFDTSHYKYQATLKNTIKSLIFIDYSGFGLSDLEQVMRQLKSGLNSVLYINAENDFILMHLAKYLTKKLGEDKYLDLLSYINSNSSYASNQLNVDLINNPVEYLDFESRFYGRSLIDMDLESPFEDFIRPVNYHGGLKPKATNQKLVKLTFTQKLFKKYLINREQNRVYRSQIFHIYRQLYTQFGEIFANYNLIDQVQDIHYLTIEEVERVTNHRFFGDVRELILLRQKGFMTQNIRPKKYIASVFKFNEEGQELVNTNVGDVNQLIIKGQACSNGQVTGVIGQDILLTPTISPGQVVELGGYKAILIVHGGLLSHGAILARELQIPALINLDANWKNLKEGQKVNINTQYAQVEILSNP